MNYLAHLHLAGDNPATKVGAFLGDYVKGPLHGALPAGIEAGIAQHRKIDAYTDSHVFTANAKTLFEPSERRYVGIALDMICDHLLARQWAHYSQQNLKHFAVEQYDLLAANSHYFNPRAQLFFSRLQQYNLLAEYQHWPIIERSLHGIANRLKKPEPMLALTTKLHAHLDPIAAEFEPFYQDLIQRCGPEALSNE